MKEIVSKVLKIEVLEANIKGKYIEFYSNTLVPCYYYGNAYHASYSCYVQKINIHELAHKCKEWAYAYGYFISSKYYSTSSGKKKANATIIKMDDFAKPYTSTNESYAIFLACQWILDNKDEQ